MVDGGAEVADLPTAAQRALVLGRDNKRNLGGQLVGMGSKEDLFLGGFGACFVGGDEVVFVGHGKNVGVSAFLGLCHEGLGMDVPEAGGGGAEMGDGLGELAGEVAEDAGEAGLGGGPMEEGGELANGVAEGGVGGVAVLAEEGVEGGGVVFEGFRGFLSAPDAGELDGGGVGGDAALDQPIDAIDEGGGGAGGGWQWGLAVAAGLADGGEDFAGDPLLKCPGLRLAAGEDEGVEAGFGDDVGIALDP